MSASGTSDLIVLALALIGIGLVALKSSSLLAVGTVAAGPQTFVGSTAWMVMGLRAIETLQPNPLLNDSLAVALSGGEQAVRSKWQGAIKRAEGDTLKRLGAKAAAGKHIVNDIALRARYLDDEVLAALRPAPNASRDAPNSGNVTHQVVLLGAGMDTRPWRLDLPPGVAWFEVDRQDVVVAKRHALAHVGASTHGAASAASGGGRGGSPAHGRRRHGSAFPLRATAWSSLVADLTDPALGSRLKEAGLRAGVPSVFVIEGVLYYLQPEEAKALLQRLQSVAERGSRLVLTALNEAMHAWFESEEYAATNVSGDASMAALLTTWHTWLPGDPAALEAYLAAAGWKLRSKVSSQGAAERYGAIKALGSMYPPQGWRAPKLGGAAAQPEYMFIAADRR